MRSSKNAIALLLTIMFVIVITVAIGIGLKEVNSATSEIKNEKFMYQSSILIEDVLKILSQSKELKAIVDEKSSAGLYLFLSQAEIIPFESSGMNILLSIKSARAKFNPNNLDAYRTNAMKYYMQEYGVNGAYVDMLVDARSGVKLDASYNSSIFDEQPYLFRDAIVSAKHLEKINDFYAKEYNDNSLENIKLQNLFYFTQESNTSIDLNYATSEVWELLIGATKERAAELRAGGGYYASMDDMNLNSDEKFKLSKFKTSFFQAYILVSIEVFQNKSKSKIVFEYDIKNKKGSNFVYEI